MSTYIEKVKPLTKKKKFYITLLHSLFCTTLKNSVQNSRSDIFLGEQDALVASMTKSILPKIESTHAINLATDGSLLLTSSNSG